MTWLYILKDYSQVPSALKQFYDEIKNHFSVSIKTL